MWPDVESLIQHARVNEALMEAEAQIRKVLAFGVYFGLNSLFLRKQMLDQ